MGDDSLSKLPHIKGVIDYANSKHKSQALDIFLGAKCHLCISNNTGFDALPAGFREHTTNVNAFQEVLNKTRYWTSESTPKYVEMVSSAQTLTQNTSGNEALAINGYSVRLKRNAGYNGWNGDPDYLTDKFECAHLLQVEINVEK